MKRFLSLLLIALQIGAPVYAAKISEDVLTIGKPGSTAVKEIRLGSKGRIRANATTGTIEKSEDGGSNYSSIGAGGSGEGGVNILTNPDFESGTTGYTYTGAGTFAVTTTPGEFGNGKKSAKIDFAAASETFDSALVTIPDRIAGNECLVQIWYYWPSGTAGDITLKVLDGSANELASVSLPRATQWTPAYQILTCPSSGNQLKYRLLSNADAAPIFVDDGHLGSNIRSVKVGGESFVANAYYAGTASCVWALTSTTFTDFSTTAACPAPTVVRNPGPEVVSTADADLPQITMTNVQPGTYTVQAQFTQSEGTSGSIVGYRISDGSSTSGDTYTKVSTTSADHPPINMTGVFTYTTAQSSVTFKIQGAASSGTALIDNTVSITGIKGLAFTIKRTSLSSQDAYTLDSQGWHVDANISGANISLGTANVSTYSPISNGSLALTQNTGSADVMIPCSSTNTPTGTTCSVGNESVGVAFTIPQAGVYQACASFAWGGSVTAAASSVSAAFELVQTPTNSDTTISKEGNGRVNGAVTINNAANTEMPFPNLCGDFVFTSAGQKVVRLMYEEAVSGTVNASTLIADGSASIGQRDVHFTVYPKRQDSQAIIPKTAPTVVTAEATDFPLSTAGYVSGEYAQMTGNSVTLTAGKWLVFGNGELTASNTTSPLSLSYRFYGANGNNTSTVPALITTLTGLTIVGGKDTGIGTTWSTAATNNATSVAAYPLYLQLTQSATIYLVPSTTFSAAGNAALQASITAYKIGD